MRLPFDRKHHFWSCCIPDEMTEAKRSRRNTMWEKGLYLFAQRTEKQIMKCPHVLFKLFYAVKYSLSHIGHSKSALVCVCVFCMLQRLKRNDLRCMQWFERCLVLAGLFAKAWQRLQKLSPTLTNRRKKVIVYPFEDNRATVWHRRANNEFSWERNQSEPRSLLTLMHFILAKMSIVYLLLFAFTLKSWNIPLFPDVPLCSSSLTRLWWTGDAGLGYRRKRSQRQLPLHFQSLSLLKKQQAGMAWGQYHPLQTIRHDRQDKNIVTRAVIYFSLNGLLLFSTTSCHWDCSSWSGNLNFSPC